MSYARPSVDLESYAALYHGRCKIKRLQHIARTSPTHEIDALCLAIKEAKQGRDTVLYKQLVTTLNNRGPPELNGIDEKWVATQDSWASKELDKLRIELENFKDQNSREPIRTAHTYLGDFYHKRGKLQQARGEYVKSRDHCVQPKHNVQMCLRTIIVSIESSDFPNVENYHHMAENALPDPPSNKSAVADIALVRACAGLALLVRGKFRDAANRFLSVATDPSEERTALLQQNFGDPLSLEDVGTLGALCALATFDRSALKARVLERAEFRALLELVPDVREVVSDFHASRYTKCLDTLERLRADLKLDLFVAEHVDRLYGMIRQEAIVQYVSPFLTADLSRMEKVFKTTAPKLEAELYTLIEQGAIPARIDTQKRALYRKVERTQAESLEQAVTCGQEAFNDIEAMLLRMSLIKNGLSLAAGRDYTAASSSRPSGMLGGRSGSINSITDSGFERFVGAG